MIQRYDGAQAQEATQVQTLPAGGYVCRIMGAEIASYSWGDQLVISYDIAEGEHKDHFAENYRNQSTTYGEKKWKGTYRLTIPDKSKNKYYDSTVKTFNNFLFALEDSNRGYNWDWDEKHLKGKTLGLLVREKEWEYGGRSGWTTEACTAVSVQKIRANDFKIPKPKELPKQSRPVNDYGTADGLRGIPGVDYQVGRSQSAAEGVAVTIDSDDDLPF